MKKFLIGMICFLFMVSNLYGATLVEIQPYVGKYVSLHINMGIWGGRTYIGKIIDLYEIKSGEEIYNVITLVNLDKTAETIKIDYIDRIKIVDLFDL